MKLVRVPAGEFMMGAEEDQDATMTAFPSADPALLPRESPRHKVRITKPFYMGQYEATLGQFMTFLREAGYKIDAERDGKPMTGTARTVRLSNHQHFVRARLESRTRSPGGIRFVERRCRVL